MKHLLMIAPALKKGGMERQLSIFLKYFDRTKLKVTLALYEKEIEYIVPADVNVINLKKSIRFNPFFIFRLVKLLANKQYDVINSKSKATNSVIMLLCGILRRKKLILEIRTTGDDPSSYKKLKQYFRLFKFNWKVVCNSKKALEILSSSISDANLYFIGNGIDSNEFKPRNLKSSKKNIIGYVGRILPLKNIEIVIKAFSILKSNMRVNEDELELVISGSVVDQLYYNDIKLLIANLGLEKDVILTGDIEDVASQLNLMDVFVLPSFYEGTPNSLLEAMSCGRLCLISKGANTDSFLSEDFVFATQNDRELAKKIKNIIELSDDQKDDIRKKNRDFVLANYSAEKMVSKLTEMSYK